MTRATRNFYTRGTPNVLLHYSANLEGWGNWPQFLRYLESELDDLAREFGFRLRGRLVVFLFSDGEEVSRIHGSSVGGFALVQVNAVVLTAGTDLEEFTRHELVHLFAGRWKPGVPALLQEGLATWMQRKDGGRWVESEGQALLQQRGPGLRRLLNHKFFFGPQRYTCYLLAGYFTAFLMRRYGWEPYRKLYRRATGRNFSSQFYKVFRISLDRAEKLWRCEGWARELVAQRLEKL